MYIGPDRNRSSTDYTVQREFWADAEINRKDKEGPARKFGEGSIPASLLMGALILGGFVLFFIFVILPKLANG